MLEAVRIVTRFQDVAMMGDAVEKNGVRPYI